MITPWITGAWSALAAAGVLLCGINLISGARLVGGRYRLAWTDPDRLAHPPIRRAWIQPLSTCLSALLALLVILLMFPPSPLWRPEPFAGPVIALLGFVASGVVFRGLQRQWCGRQAMLASILLSAGICGFTRTLLGGATGGRAHLWALAVGLAIATLLWAWLTRVWQQQLDGGVAWTVAGRLIPFNRVFALGNALSAVVVIWLLALSRSPITRSGVIVGLAVHAVVLLAIAVCLRRWWGAGTVILLLAAFASALTMISLHSLGG